MLQRIARLKGEINNNSFRFGYGGKILVRKVMLSLGIIAKKTGNGKKQTYALMVDRDKIDLDLVSRIIVEVYLIRNKVESI